MALIIEVVSVELERPGNEVRRLESIIAQEKVDSFVIRTTVVPDILRSWGVRQLPVFRINGVTVWEGENPPANVVRCWLHWPRTLDEAVEQVLASVDSIPQDPLMHMELGTAIRNSFGLWGANKELLRSCGSEIMSAEDASDVILNKARGVQRIRNK